MPFNQAVEQILDAAVELYRQPIFSCEEKLSYYEVLCRFRQDGKLHNPIEWITWLEKYSMAPLLDRVVTRKLFSYLSGTRDKSIYAVNLSAQTCNSDENFLLELEREMVDTKISPHQIQFEITESVLLENNATTSSFVSYLRAQHRISFDDVGANGGFLGTSLLDRYRPHSVKIDGQYIRSLPSKMAMVDMKALISVSKARGCSIVAECVETQEQARICCELGCDLLQGYYLGKPEPLRCAQLQCL